VSIKRKPTRSGNPAVPPPPKLSMAAGRLTLISDRRREHAPSPTGHRWILLAMHQVDPSAREFYLSEHTLVEAHRPKCAHCGVAYNPIAASGYCPGVQQPDPAPTSGQDTAHG
jgi:hypothetical protein